MLKKIQNMLVVALSKTDKLQIRGMPRVMVYLFLLLVIICMLLFMAAWSWQWNTTGKADLSIMIQFITAITSVSFIAAVGFFSKAMVDKDNDGIPDEWEGFDIGEKTIELLLSKLKSVKRVKESNLATLEEILGKAKAKIVWAFFNP